MTENLYLNVGNLASHPMWRTYCTLVCQYISVGNYAPKSRLILYSNLEVHIKSVHKLMRVVGKILKNTKKPQFVTLYCNIFPSASIISCGYFIPVIEGVRLWRKKYTFLLRFKILFFFLGENFYGKVIKENQLRQYLERCGKTPPG